MGPQDATDRIAELEDEARQKDARILELRRELDEAQALISDMREHVRDAGDIIDSWKEAFGMHLTDDGWTWADWMKRCEGYFDMHNALIAKWNRTVNEFNTVIAPRPIGRPLAASEAQQARVRALRKAGKSMRAIAVATSLSLSTVRTIIEKAAGTDRTTKAAFERIAVDRDAVNTERAMRRTRDGLPKRLTALDTAGKELMRRAGVSARR
jgi:hypothetical protein